MKKILILSLSLTPLYVYLAYIERGYFAVGPEWVMGFMPLLIIQAKNELMNF